MPVSQEGWLRAKLTDPRAVQVLQRMTADLKPGDSRAAKLTGAMIVKEFMTQDVAPLQARPRPLWKLEDEGDDLRLRPEALSVEELGSALRSLVGDDQGYPLDSFVPLYCRPDGAEAAAAMPIFDERGLVSPAPSDVLVTTTPVVVSSDEEKEKDSEATLEGSGETAPPRKADLLRAMPDDDDADDHLAKEVPPPAGVTTRPRVSPSGKPTSSSKKKKERAATPLGAPHLVTATPPLAQKGGDSARISLARSSSRGPEERPQERAPAKASSAPEALIPSPSAEAPQAPELLASSSVALNLQVLAMTLPPSSAPPPARDPSTSPDALEHALSALARLQGDLQGADHRLVVGRLELISGWLHSDASVWEALSQAMAASERDKQATAQAAAACEVALKDAGLPRIAVGR
nr:proline-rich protein 36-like [Aegilops tauschii subsp. strangulata]